jgi:hypothetical protein
MRRHQISSEFEHYRRTLQCPNGHRHALTFIEGSGEVLENLRLRDRLMLDNPLPRFDDRMASMQLVGRLRQFNHDRSGGLSIQRFRVDSMFACATCSERWPVFVQRELKVIDYQKTGLSQTLIGPDVRRLDQTQSCTLEFTHEWVERIEFGSERQTSLQKTCSAGIKGTHGSLNISADIQQRITESLKVTHSLTSQTRRTTTHKLEHVLPAGKVTVIKIYWKQVWQEYECRVRLPDNDEIVPIPYRVAFDVVFDQEVEDI